jgi:hypothetical protein
LYVISLSPFPGMWFLPSIRLPLVVLAAILAMFAETRAASPPPEKDIHAAARAAMGKFEKSLTSKEVKETHGFAGDDDFSQIEFGRPVEQKLLRQDRLKEEAHALRLEEILVPTSVWYVPVRSKGKLACLVSVRHEDGKHWVEDKLGMVELARALDAVAEAWPKDKGFTPVLVIVPAMQRFYFQIPEKTPVNLTYLDIRAPKAGSAETWKELSPAESALAELKQ